jgi:hypothetical protein
MWGSTKWKRTHFPLSVPEHSYLCLPEVYPFLRKDPQELVEVLLGRVVMPAVRLHQLEDAVVALQPPCGLGCSTGEEARVLETTLVLL